MWWRILFPIQLCVAVWTLSQGLFWPCVMTICPTGFTVASWKLLNLPGEAIAYEYIAKQTNLYTAALKFILATFLSEPQGGLKKIQSGSITNPFEINGTSPQAFTLGFKRMRFLHLQELWSWATCSTCTFYPLCNTVLGIAAYLDIFSHCTF